jgi:subtilisin family serine protease
MPKKTTPRSTEADDQPPVTESELPVGPTGRFLVTMAPGSQRSLIKTLKDSAGITAASTADSEDSKADIESLGGGDALLFEHLSVAVVSGEDADKIQSMEMAVADDSNPIVAVEPEEYVQAINDQGFLTSAGREYVRGYRDGIATWGAQLLEGQAGAAEAELFIATTFADTPQFTWGLQATRTHLSTATGAGLRVAVLDTGFDLQHPDFVGRQVISATFVGQPVQDGHGHGTHCIGTALGDRMRAGGVRRYGCARQGTILVGKVLSNAGSGQDAGILAGINWAIHNGARVISMSLGAPVAIGTPPTVAYENAGRAALNAGSLIIAAAGNNGNNSPVSKPANSPSIMAVAAVDQSLHRAIFSCSGINPNGGEVNIAGPGVGVFSSTKMPTRYAVFQGTSMATPHVAGIAALWSQRTGLRAIALWQKLISTALNIGQPVSAVGRGLVQAPVP